MKFFNYSVWGYLMQYEEFLIHGVKQPVHVHISGYNMFAVYISVIKYILE